MNKMADPVKQSGSLAAHFERVRAGRSIGKLREDMAAAGHSIGNGTLQRLQSGDTGVRIDSIRKFATFAGMSEDELLRETAEQGDFVEVRHADVKFSNGRGQVVYREDDKPPLSFRADYLRRLQIPQGKAVVVDAGGISNEPKIMDGSVVLINTADRERLDDGLFAFNADGEVLIKRLQRIEGVGILATAENSNFKPKSVVYTDPERIFVIGRAVWTGAEL